jgi:hypothetical protein
MTFDEILAQVLELLQSEKRVSYRAVPCTSALGLPGYPCMRASCMARY